MEKNRIYLRLAIGNREIFKSSIGPTRETHGDKYNATIGPFKTMRAARFMRDYGQGNPHCQCVADAGLLSDESRLPKLSKGYNQYGASMGRGDSIPEDARETAIKLRMVKMRLCGDYDEGGAYWGSTAGTAIYRAYGETDTEVCEIFTRQATREDAKQYIRGLVPLARFYN